MLETRNEIQKGDKVRWKSQAMGIEKKKIGVVLEVIPSGISVKQFIPFGPKKSHKEITMDGNKTAVLPEIKNPEVLQRAISEYGKRAQVDIAIEEMSELTKALLKYRRARLFGTVNDQRKGRESIVEEAADVLITVAQVIMMYDYDNEIQAAVDLKVNRLRDRLGNAPVTEDTGVCKPSAYNDERVLSRMHEILSNCDEVPDWECQEMFCADCQIKRIIQAINEE